MDDLITEFIAETRDMLAALGGEIVAWEAAPEDKARLDAIFRFVHTVKGNSGFFDLPRLTALSHAAEDALADLRAGRRRPDRALVSAVLAIVDRISELVEAMEGGGDGVAADDAPLIAALSGSPAPAATAPAREQRPARSIRLPVELLDRMMTGVSDLVLARNELARSLRGGGVGLDEAFERVSASVADVREAITRTRMQRIESLFAPLPKLVRDLSAETGKSVVLTIDGGDVELDREMIELIRDPLTHMIRNAIDHGIESPDERRAAGKSEAGSLRIGARQAGNQILIEIADDGRGIDGAALAARATAAGILTAEQAAALAPERRLALIFEAGLSTASEVTAISGRGVGMDVVRSNVERIGGLIDLESKPGAGVRFTLRVPLTLTIIAGLTIAAGGQTFAVPRSAIEEIVRAAGDGVRVDRVAGSWVATVRQRRLPVVRLDEVLGTKSPSQPSDQILVLLKGAGGGVYALAVDRVHDHEEMVVKPASPAVMATGLYAGTTLADDGRPVLLLDPAGIGAGAAAVPQSVPAPAPPAEARETRPALLFTSLCGARRAIALAAVKRIEEVAAESIAATGGRFHVAIGEDLLALAGCDEVPAGSTRVLRLSDGVADIGYAVREVLDTIEIPSGFAPAAEMGEVQGVVLVDGGQVELVDLHWLFARSRAGGNGERPLCALPAADPWADTFLRPIVEAAGYRVVAQGAEGAAEADLLIVSGGDSPDSAATKAQVLRLRAAPEPQGEGDDSIHRYDRAALLRALDKARPGRRRIRG